MQEPSFDTWTIIFLFASVQGFFLTALLFFHKKGNEYANRLLALLMSLYSISLLYYVLYWTGYTNMYSWLNNWVDAIPFLFGPVTYFYLQVLEEKKLPKYYALHLIPFASHFVFSLPFIIRNIFGRVQFLGKHFFSLGNTIDYILYAFIALQCISLFVYSFLLFRHMRIDKSKLIQYALPVEYAKHSWVGKVVFFFCGFSIAFISYWLLVVTHLLKIEYDYAISFAMSAFVYLVGYLGFKQPELFHEIPEFQNQHIAKLHLQIGKAPVSMKYKNSSLKQAEAEMIEERLTLLMQTEKPYINSELKIQDLAVQLKISSHHLSQVLNDLMGVKYTDLINNYRIEEAKRILSDKNYDGKILSVAFDVGYTNKATFNVAFKKLTGVSPSDYRISVLKKVSA